MRRLLRVLALLLALTGCGLVQEAVKAMFFPNAQAVGDLGGAIEVFFDLYPGPTEDCEILSPVGVSKHLKYGRQTIANIHNSFPVVCGGVNYYCSFSYVKTYEDDPGNVGVKRVILATEATKCHPDYYQNTRSIGDGLTVVTQSAVEGETRRIGARPYAFTPYDRTIAREDGGVERVGSAILQDGRDYSAFGVIWRMEEPNE